MAISQDPGRYVYHYYAYYKEGAWRTYMDGLLHLNKKILSMDDYDKAKKMIAEGAETNIEIIIKSLTLIGHEDD